MKRTIGVLAAVAGLGMGLCACAAEIAYDTGAMGVAYDPVGGGQKFAVRFTNDNAYDVVVRAALIRGHDSVQGNLDVMIWADNGGIPGAPLATLPNQHLSYVAPTGFASFDVSASDIVIKAGESVFAGLSPISCKVPYDDGTGQGAHNWWMATTTWAAGQPAAVAGHNLAVRLEVSRLGRGALFTIH